MPRKLLDLACWVVLTVFPALLAQKQGLHPLVGILGVWTILGSGFVMQYSEFLSNGNCGADREGD